MSSAKAGGFRNEEVGKFLVLRRDGSVPDWSWFVLGAADKAAPEALYAYADAVRVPMCSAEVWDYSRDVHKIGDAFVKERVEREKAGKKKGDPEAGKHRTDDPLIIALMKGEVTWPEIRACLYEHECRCVATGECEACRVRKKVRAAVNGARTT